MWSGMGLGKRPCENLTMISNSVITMHKHKNVWLPTVHNTMK